MRYDAPMKRLLLIPALLVALAFAGCAEHYDRINDTQILVSDEDGAVDLSNITDACARYGLVIDHVDGVGGDERPLLVTCKAQ